MAENFRTRNPPPLPGLIHRVPVPLSQRVTTKAVKARAALLRAVGICENVVEFDTHQALHTTLGNVLLAW